MSKNILVLILVLLASSCPAQSLVEQPLVNGKLDPFFAVPINAFISDPMIKTLYLQLQEGRLDLVTVGRMGRFNEHVSFWMSVKRTNDIRIAKTYSPGGLDMIAVYYYKKDGKERLLYSVEFNKDFVPSEIYARLTNLRMVKLYRVKDIKSGEYKTVVCDMFIRVKAAPIGRIYETFDNEPYCFIKKSVALDNEVPYEFGWFFEFGEMLKDQVNSKLEEDLSVEKSLQDSLDKDN